MYVSGSYGFGFGCIINYQEIEERLAWMTYATGKKSEEKNRGLNSVFVSSQFVRVPRMVLQEGQASPCQSSVQTTMADPRISPELVSSKDRLIKTWSPDNFWHHNLTTAGTQDVKPPFTLKGGSNLVSTEDFWGSDNRYCGGLALRERPAFLEPLDVRNRRRQSLEEKHITERPEKMDRKLGGPRKWDKRLSSENPVEYLSLNDGLYWTQSGMPIPAAPTPNSRKYSTDSCFSEDMGVASLSDTSSSDCLTHLNDHFGQKASESLEGSEKPRLGASELILRDAKSLVLEMRLVGHDVQEWWQWATEPEPMEPENLPAKCAHGSFTQAVTVKRPLQLQLR